MEECLITKRKLPEEDVVYTIDGAVAAFLWGRKQINMDGEFALIPPELAERYRKAVPHADASVFENGA